MKRKTMSTQVFIVNENTFAAHLQYMFAGTSSGKKDWNIALLADIKRVRTGDKVLFYHERVGFYGIFKIKDNRKQSNGKHIVYYDKDNDCDGILGKKLIYRVLIEPDEVYPNPVSEWEALESLPDNPRDIIWSLIYRKLKGGRGCSPVTPKESDRLIRLIRQHNNEQPIATPGSFTWEDGRIVSVEAEQKIYDTSNAEELDIEDMLYAKRKVETYLQAYFTENAGNPNLDGSVFSEICGESGELIWLGNEFYCGVGMQKIDVFTIKNRRNSEFRVIELKTTADTGIHRQLERYVKWCREYLCGTTAANLQPIIVVPYLEDRSYANELEKTILPTFNNRYKDACLPVQWYEFYFDEEKKIQFQKVEY